MQKDEKRNDWGRLPSPLSVNEKPWPISPGKTLPAVPDKTGNQQAITQFKPGVSGNPNGRPKGARNKLTELFLNMIIEDFAEHGEELLARLRKEDPVTYIKLIALLLPKTLIEKYETQPDKDYAKLTQEEAVQLIEETQRRRFIEKTIESVSR